jgi:hypothetical protein
MADEKKTYLINIESNLKKYADEAAEAKKKVDELKAANDLLKNSGLQNTAEFQANTAELKTAQKEYKNLQKAVEAQIILNNKESTYREKLVASKTIEIAKLKELGSGYIKNAQGLDVVNPKYVETTRRIGEINAAIIKNDKSMNDGRTNIGRYGESVKAAFGSVVELAKGLGIAAAAGKLASYVFTGLKDAFLSMDEGIGMMKQWTEVTKTYFYALLNLRSFNAGDLQKAMASAKELNDIRIKERKDLREIATLEGDLRDLRLAAADATISEAEKIIILSSAQKVEAQIIELKKNNLLEEIRALEQLWTTRKKDSDLMDIINQKRIELINLQGSESIKIETMITGLEEKRKIRTKDLQDEVSALKLKGFEKDSELLFRAAQKELLAIETTEEQKKLIIEKYGIEFNDLAKKYDTQNAADIAETLRIQNEYDLKALEDILDAEYQALQISDEYIGSSQAHQLLLDAQYTEAKKQLSLKRIDQLNQEKLAVANALSAMSELIGNQTNIGKAMAVAAATINTWVAASQALADPSIPSVVLRVAAMIAIIATGLNNVKNILAVKVPGGGSGSVSAPTSISSSATAQRSFATQAGSTILTQRQLSQPELNAVPNKNPLTAEDITNILGNLPPSVVTVEDINRVGLSKRKVEVRAII